MTKKIDRTLYDLGEADVDLLWGLLSDHLTHHEQMTPEDVERAMRLAKEVAWCMPAREKRKALGRLDDLKKARAVLAQVPDY